MTMAGAKKPAGEVAETQSPGASEGPSAEAKRAPVPSMRARSDTGELEARANQLGLLVEASAALAGAMDAESTLAQILPRLCARARLTHAAVYRLIPHERRLRCVASTRDTTSLTNQVLRPAQHDELWCLAHASDPAAVKGQDLHLDDSGLAPWVARHGEPADIPVAAEDARSRCDNPPTQSEYAVPLAVGSKTLGVLHIESDQPDGIRAVTRKLVDQFAAQAALALERSELHKELEAAQERLRSLLERGGFGVYLVTLHEEFTSVNPAFAQLLGYGPEQLDGKPFTELIHAEDREASREGMKKLLEGRTTQLTLENRYLHKSGEAIWCTTIASLVRDSAGQPAYLLALVQDIQARKKVEEERAWLQERLMQAQKREALGTLAAGIAHDFNNLLSVMLGVASTLRVRLAPEDPMQGPVRMIEQSAQRAADLTRQLLGFVHPGSEQARTASVQSVLDRVVSIVSQTFDRRICLRLDWAHDPLWVGAEPGALEQAVLNLCINARDAMLAGGTLTLATSAVTVGSHDGVSPAECPPGRYVRIAVCDTGAGIEPQVLPRLFEPFFTTKEAGQGTGLGLTMVRRFVRSHGGFVHVESKLGEGAQFAIYLPAVQAPPAPARPQRPIRVQRGCGTVLVVDDEPLVLATVEQGLKRLGYQVFVAEDGERALGVYAPRAAEIDVVLLDVMMPGVSGIEMCLKMRHLNSNVKVILSSGYCDRVAREARAAGAVDFITKPYTLEDLSLILGRHIRH